MNISKIENKNENDEFEPLNHSKRLLNLAINTKSPRKTRENSVENINMGASSINFDP